MSMRQEQWIWFQLCVNTILQTLPPPQNRMYINKFFFFHCYNREKNPTNVSNRIKYTFCVLCVLPACKKKNHNKKHYENIEYKNYTSIAMGYTKFR